MANVQDSEYQFNSPFSLSKRIVAYLIDSLLLILAVILCFQLVDMMYVNFNTRLKEVNSQMAKEENEIIACLADSGLMQYDEQGYSFLKKMREEKELL